MANPNVCVLKTDGINCDYEMQHAFETAGAAAEIIHVNQLRSGDRKLQDYDILAIPGGFSYGDDIASGKVLANELTSYFSDQLQEFIDKEKPILGVCNGDQVLVRTGLLPFRNIGKQVLTLAQNHIGRFDCRWIDLSAEESVCRFVAPEDFSELPIPMQTAHGEGMYRTSPAYLDTIEQNRQVVFRYVNRDGSEAGGYPANPNGSMRNIAGICDQTGLILGMMPHPERSIEAFHPHRARTRAARTAAQIIFRNIVNYTKEL